MSDYYDALGISHGASPAMVKMAYEGRLKALAKEKLSPQQRKAEEKVLQQALAVLSDPAKREWYDKQLEAEHRAEDEPAESPRSKLPIAAVAVGVVVLAAVGVGWYVTHPSAEKVERERKGEDARSREAYEKKMENVGANKNPNPFRGGPMTDTKERIIKNAAEREAAKK